MFYECSKVKKVVLPLEELYFELEVPVVEEYSVWKSGCCEGRGGDESRP